MRKNNERKCYDCKVNLDRNELQKKLIRLRERVHTLYFSFHWSKRKISRKLRVSLNFVLKWTRHKTMDYTSDQRGWKKHRGRKWDKTLRRRLYLLHEHLRERQSFYTGPTALVQQWIKTYGEFPPPLRTIGWMMKQMGLTQSNKKIRHKGAARYLCYPEYSIHHWAGKRVLEVDFIGKKFIAGQTAPIHFGAASFKYEPRLRYFQRVAAENADCLQQFLAHVFAVCEIPDVVKMDNGFAMTGSSPWPRVLGKLPLWLLEQKIYPMYAVPRRPFSQASIEGNNSVFGRKFWNRYVFEDLRQIDRELTRFNYESRQYYQYSPPVRKASKGNFTPLDKYPTGFTPRIFYLRQVRADERGKAFIEVAHDSVRLPKTFLNYFVFAEWNLFHERLTVFLEKNQTLRKIKSINFALNQKSKEKLWKIYSN